MVWEFTCGRMVENVTVNGLTVICRGTESLFMPMEFVMTVSTLSINDKGMECTSGQMAEFMRVGGIWENNMVLVSITQASKV